MNAIKRWPLSSFFLLSYVFTWWIVPLHIGGFPVFPFGPVIALLIVVGVTVGRGGVRQIFVSLIAWRASLGWYAFAVLLPVVIAMLAVSAMPPLGAPVSELPGLSSAFEFAVILPLAILIGGPLGEEPAWRGYALPVLQQRYSPLIAVLFLGVLHALWHLPLFFASDPPPVAPFIIELISGGVVLAWLMNSTGLVLLALIMHGTHNMSQQAFMSGFAGANLTTVQWLTAIGWAIAALVVIWRTRGTLTPAGRMPLTVPLYALEKSSATTSHRGAYAETVK